MNNKKTDTKGIVQIHGKDYMTVARRLELAHEEKSIEEIQTEVIPTTDSHVVIRARVKLKGVWYSGISSVSLDSSRMIEKSNPYEVAETSAIGRALGLAGYGLLESIASADDMQRATTVRQENGWTYEKTENGIEDEQEPPVKPVAPKVTEVTCQICGEPAKEKEGITKSGKKYHGIFCSTEDKSHTRWLWN